jgi:hypothetical protein
MARKVREVPQSVAKRLTKQLPKLSPLLREGFKSMWTDKQCDAWARRAKPADVLHQAHDWVTAAATALAREDHEDVPYSKQRLAWLAELTVRLEEQVAGTPKTEVVQAQQARDGAMEESKQLRARMHSRMVLLVGGDEERAAALSIASKGEVGGALSHLHELLSRWRRDARLRVLSDELGLDESMLVRSEGSAKLLRETELQTVSHAPHVSPIEGRVLRELRALQLAFAAARDEGLKVPTLKVRAPLAPLLSSRGEAED